MEVVRKDLNKCNRFEDLVHDRLECRNIIHVDDSNMVGTWDMALMMLIRKSLFHRTTDLLQKNL